MENIGFYSTEYNIKTIIDAMELQTKQIIEEIVRNNEVITIKVTEISVTNGSNIMDIDIEDNNTRKVTSILKKCFDDKVIYLRQKIKREVCLEKTKRRNLRWYIIL